MSSFVLKLIAVITMVIDHIGLCFFPEYEWIRYIGRISFPLFAFLLTEGFIHTSDKTKYAVRLGVFALISEIPYDLCIYGRVFDFGHQNIFFELLCGLAVLACIEEASKKPVFFALIPLLFLFSSYLNFSYGIYGIALMAMFYILRDKPVERAVSAAAVTVFFNGAAALGFDILGGNISILSVNYTQMYAAAATVPLLFYSGKKGRYSFKWFFYGFYPIHLIVLFLVKWILSASFSAA